MARLRVLIPADKIRLRVAELGAQIAADYTDGSPLYLIGVLKGSCIFLADLARAIPPPLQPRVRLEFMGVSSYGDGTATSGEMRLTKDLDGSIQDCHVIVVEDVADTGLTLSFLLGLLRDRHPKTLRVAALLDKTARRRCPVPVDYAVFPIPDVFVVGYGLDYAQDYRGLPDVCVLELEPSSATL